MTTVDFITELYCRIADRLAQVDKKQKHRQAKLYPSEVVTLAVLYTLKGSGQRAFWRWLTRDYARSFRSCLTAHACFACSIAIVRWSMSSWRNPRCWV